MSRWTRLRSFAVGKYKAVQLSIERRSFESKLESIVRTALAHQQDYSACVVGDGRIELGHCVAQGLTIGNRHRLQKHDYLLLGYRLHSISLEHNLMLFVSNLAKRHAHPFFR